ncbi:DUF538 family protein [Quillaja saponaria]|uniref:DUF538 family protein n=1 Tax=Quillaja saponaria TaxID=32244 RepID=A0AAD7VNA1_QUISA|nr:DUF538 family protein [Quillaja saponaria]
MTSFVPKAYQLVSFQKRSNPTPSLKMVYLEVFLNGPCLTKFENRVFFESVIKANLTYGRLVGVEGLTQEELFVWLPVKGIVVNDPTSGVILFDIGLAYKQFSLSLFEDPPECTPQDVLRNHVRKERGFEAILR